MGISMVLNYDKSDQEPMIEQSQITIENLSKIFQYGKSSTMVLDAISQKFSAGTTYAIIGASGVGKSTLMHLLVGLDKPTSGKVLYNGRNINRLTSNETDQFRNQEVGLLFQDSYLIKELTALENVIMKGIIAHRDRKECRDEGIELLKAVGLSEKISSLPPMLSGGQQQRVALARALFGNPSFIFADEPTGNLDITTGKKMVELMLNTVKKLGAGLIVSTHDPYVYERMEVVFELKEGKLYPR
jgi:ABC-type lipoprotein export system ATPase subunit